MKVRLKPDSLAGLLLACGLCLFLAAPAVAEDLPTAEEVFAKYTAAIGGDALENVKNVASKFTFSAPEMITSFFRSEMLT